MTSSTGTLGDLDGPAWRLSRRASAYDGLLRGLVPELRRWAALADRPGLAREIGSMADTIEAALAADYQHGGTLERAAAIACTWRRARGSGGRWHAFVGTEPHSLCTRHTAETVAQSAAQPVLRARDYCPRCTRALAARLLGAVHA